MKYILSKKLEVLSFRVSSNELSYADKSKNLIFRNQIVTNNTSSNGYFLGGRYFFYGNETDYITRFIDFKTHKTMEIGYVGTPNEQLFDGEIFITHEYLDLVDFKQQLISYNIKTNKKKVIKANVGAVLLLNKNVITREGAATLKSLSLVTGKYEWEVNLAEKLGTYDAISKIYGIVNECLWLVTQRGVILGININDGKLIHHLNFDGYDTFQERGTVQMQYFRSLFDEKQQVLIGVYENRYWEIDLKADKPELQITDIKVLNPSYFNNPSFIYEVYHLAAPEGIAYNEQYIYFKDNEVSTVGVLNRQTKQIEWHDKLYELPGRSYVMIRDIQVAASNMYVLDEKGVLHIYEKE